MPSGGAVKQILLETFPCGFIIPCPLRLFAPQFRAKTGDCTNYAKPEYAGAVNEFDCDFSGNPAT